MVNVLVLVERIDDLDAAERAFDIPAAWTRVTLALTTLTTAAPVSLVCCA